MATTWRISDGSFKGFKFHVATPSAASPFGMMSQEVATERRIQISEKPGLDGAEVEDFGRKPITANCEVIFYSNDYVAQLEAFEAVLNQGTSGELILPDLSKAINAKFVRENRRTTTETATILSLSFIEDKTNQPAATSATTQTAAIAALASNNPAAAVPTINDKSISILASINAVGAVLNDNPLINAVKAANNAVVSVTSVLNAIANLPRTVRQTIISLVNQTQNNLTNIQSSIKALQNFSALLTTTTDTNGNTVGTGVFNTKLAPSDFAQEGTGSTQTVNGVTQAVATSDTAGSVGSFTDAKNQLQAQLTDLQTTRAGLDANTGGGTTDVSSASLILENQLVDMINLITPPPPIQVTSPITQSLLEICFDNGLTVDDINSVYEMNTDLVDILAIPAFTIVSLPVGVISV